MAEKNDPRLVIIYIYISKFDGILVVGCRKSHALPDGPSYGFFFHLLEPDQGCDQESTDEGFQDSIVKRVKSFVGGDFFLRTSKKIKTLLGSSNFMIELKKD